jgi:hypothetical protein
MKKIFFFAAALCVPFMFNAQIVETIIDFEDVPFPDGQNHWNGSDESGDFSIFGATFTNTYNADWSSWSGFAVSSEVDTETAGWLNQYSCFAGEGAESTENFAIWYANGEITFSEPSLPLFMSVTNTTFAALAMRDGDAYAKQFGSIYDANGDEDGTEGKDWFKLTITGIDEDNEPTGIIEFYLADFRSEDSSEHYIIDTWENIELQSLGNVKKMIFELQSTDVGQWGMNTPNYFALDQFHFIEGGVGLNESAPSTFSIFPNPAQNFVNIRQTEATEFSVSLIDFTGAIVLNSAPSLAHSLDLNNLPNGVYFLQMTSERGMKTEKLVISH